MIGDFMHTQRGNSFSARKEMTKPRFKICCRNSCSITNNTLDSTKCYHWHPVALTIACYITRNIWQSHAVTFRWLVAQITRKPGGCAALGPDSLRVHTQACLHVPKQHLPVPRRLCILPFPRAWGSSTKPIVIEKGLCLWSIRCFYNLTCRIDHSGGFWISVILLYYLRPSISVILLSSHGRRCTKKHAWEKKLFTILDEKESYWQVVQKRVCRSVNLKYSTGELSLQWTTLLAILPGRSSNRKKGEMARNSSWYVQNYWGPCLFEKRTIAYV